MLRWFKLAMDDDTAQPDLDESAPTTSRRSGRNARVEIITRAEGRRSWTVEQKREIVAESFGLESTPTEVARKHAISSGQLYTWRQQQLGMQSAVVTRGGLRFAEVKTTSALRSPDGDDPVSADAHPGPPAPTKPSGLMEIVLCDGVVLRVDAHVDGGALRRVLDALERR